MGFQNPNKKKKISPPDLLCKQPKIKIKRWRPPSGNSIILLFEYDKKYSNQTNKRGRNNKTYNIYIARISSLFNFSLFSFNSVGSEYTQERFIGTLGMP